MRPGLPRHHRNRQAPHLPLLHLLHRNRYGSSPLQRSRLQAEVLDQPVLAAVGNFYRNHTRLLIEAVNAAATNTAPPSPPPTGLLIAPLSSGGG